jgi:pimeloyl-ACP methyl ester carboxylesterase
MRHLIRATLVALIGFATTSLVAQEFADSVEHKFADSNGVSIHYAKAGSGPLAVFIHGFPDFWYSWRHQMEGLATTHTVVAMDTRGYNKSDQPTGVGNYDMSLLIADVAAVIENEGGQQSVIIGHYWGGGIAWSFAAARPDLTNHLIILNLPHVKNLAIELAKHEDQYRNSEYARNFQKEDSHLSLDPARLANSHGRGDPVLKAKYVTAFENSSTEAMMNYYRANFPREPFDSTAFMNIERIQMPVLQFHGLKDRALLPASLNNTWEELDQDWTLVTIPDAGHWPHRDKPDMVTNMMKAWLALHQ